MLRLIRRELNELDAGRKALRSFGLVVGGVLLAIATVVIWQRDWAPGTLAYVLVAAGALLILFGAAAPRPLRPVYFVWMGLALVLGIIMTRILLTVVFYAVVTPTALFLRVVGRDPLHRTIERDAPSYWIPKVYDDPSPSRFEKYY